eukprot:4065971-Prymnesium_polylepis.2
MLAVKHYLLEIVAVAFRLVASLDVLRPVIGNTGDHTAPPSASAVLRSGLHLERPGTDENGEQEAAASPEHTRPDQSLSSRSARFSGVGGALENASAETLRVMESFTKQATQAVGGTTARVVGVTSLLLGGIAGVASAIALDEDYQNREQLLQQRAPKTTRQGLRLGFRGLTDGLSSATEGVVLHPLEGARRGGALGFVRGVYRSIHGLVIKPLAGTALLGAKGTEGLASDVIKATHAMVLDQYVRMRQPRLLGSGQNSRVLPYPCAVLASFDVSEGSRQQ